MFWSESSQSRNNVQKFNDNLRLSSLAWGLSKCQSGLRGMPIKFPLVGTSGYPPYAKPYNNSQNFPDSNSDRDQFQDQTWPLINISSQRDFLMISCLINLFNFRSPNSEFRSRFPIEFTENWTYCHCHRGSRTFDSRSLDISGCLDQDGSSRSTIANWRIPDTESVPSWSTFSLGELQYVLKEHHIGYDLDRRDPLGWWWNHRLIVWETCFAETRPEVAETNEPHVLLHVGQSITSISSILKRFASSIGEDFIEEANWETFVDPLFHEE
jgi:hypothetical protein